VAAKSTTDGSRTFKTELKAAFIGWAGYLAIGLIGRTIRWRSVGESYLDAIYQSGNRAIFTFWHGRIFPATYFWRHRGIVVMTSMNTDGEAIARCIKRFGFGVARGSSSQGGLRALAEMARQIRQGNDAAFTVDGPRGPRYVAKQGPVLLALKTGAAIFCFHIAMKRKIQLRSWDGFQIPLPFTTAVVLQAPPIWTPPNATDAELRDIQTRMQETLDSLRLQGDALWSAQAPAPFAKRPG
jgi:lysophospholipid acyltransferase (LPLAT)-like uncharacterized protein